MLLPAVLLYLLSFAAPLVIVGRLSLFQADYVSEIFVGLENFRRALGDRFFLQSFGNAFAFMLMVTPTLTTISYWTASILSGFRSRVQSAVRFALYLPSLSAGLVMTLIWRWLLLRDGVINAVLVALNLEPVPWLTEAWPARVSVALITLAAAIGGTVILFAVSMHAIPGELRDAASVDGATERQYKRHIVRPMMLPTITLVVLLNVVGLMQIWETIYILFRNGGPEGGAATPVYEIFMTAFLFGQQGYAAAKGMLLMVVIAALLMVKQRVEKWVR